MRWPALSPLVALMVAGCGASSPAPAPPPASPSPPASSPCPSASVSEVAKPAVDVDAMKDTLLARLNARDIQGVFELFAPATQQVITLEKTRAFINEILSTGGTLRGATRLPGAVRAGEAAYLVQAERSDWHLNLHLDGEGRIAGFGFVKPPALEPPVARSDVPLRLPFRGKWTVAWGGDRADLNQHVIQKSQRRAADLVITDDHGKTFRGDGKKNEDYLAYGQEVLAVADGTVIVAIDGVPDSAPGTLNPYFALGNGVILQLTPTLYAVYAHLQPGKVRVKVGAKVRRADVLGLCGNSGNSSEPHLHFHLEDGPRLESSWGVEAVFADVTLTRGESTAQAQGYTFLKGDRIEVHR